mgnify:FL=1
MTFATVHGLALLTYSMKPLQSYDPMTATPMAQDSTFNGWANYETWNAALWIGNDEGLYHLARRCYDWQHVVRTLSDLGITHTGDGVAYDDPNLDEAELDEMVDEL